MIETIADVAGDPRERVLLVLLPPAFGTAQDFFDHGFVTAVRNRDLKVDVIAAGAIADYYLDQTVVARLHAEVIAPARAKGYQRIWLGGISIGGFGSLLTVQAHTAEIEGLLLLAPYLGSRPAVNDVLRAGSLAQWRPPPTAPDDHERQLLAWLQGVVSAPATSPPIYVGYGTQDRFAPLIEVLTNSLPEDRVVRQPGEHDWATWIALWNALLDLDPFGARPLC